MAKLKLLQIGAGSMGTRRLRDLSSHPDVEIALFESRDDRRERAAQRFGVRAFANLEDSLSWQPQGLVISTPPDQHERYVKLALDRGIHHFSEANIWTYDAEAVEEISQHKKLVSAASSSLHFLPVVEQLTHLVREELGHLHAYQMVLNTYLPDWHPGEGKEYYARNRNTAAGREMVPFELLWLNEVFGVPREVSGWVAGRGKLGVPEDTWSLQITLESGAVGQLQVLMACPGALRQGWCLGDAGQVHFDLFAGTIRRMYRSPAIDDRRSFGMMRDVLEEAYRREITTFVDAILGRATWPQSYPVAAMATATLAAAERSASTRNVELVNIQTQPQRLLEVSTS